MGLLVIAIVLALIGVGGLAAGAADDNSNGSKSAGSATTTTTELSTDTSLPLVTVPVPSTGVTTTTRKTTATTKASTGTTQAPAAACASSAGSGNPGGPKAPAVGTYSYVSCTSDDKVNVVVSAGNSSGGVTRRDIETQSQLGNITAHDAFGADGAVQERATIKAFGFTLNCDWMPDIIEYPANLAVGTSWSADSQCNLGNGAKIHATGTRKITSVATFTVGGTAVVVWVIDETQKLVITAPNRSPSNFSSTGTKLYDPSRGITVHEKAVSEASGADTQPPTTTEFRLTSLTPKT